MLPAIAWYHIAGALIGKDCALEGTSQWLSLIPGRTGNLLRMAYYVRVLERCDRPVTICFGAILSKVGAQIGQHVYIGPCCQLGLVTIGRDTLLGPGVQIPSGPNTHSFDRLDIPIRMQPGDLRRVTIGDDCWLGAGSVIMADIGDQSIVGAGSVVTHPMPEKTISAGVPARIIKRRDDEAL